MNEKALNRQREIWIEWILAHGDSGHTTQNLQGLSLIALIQISSELPLLSHGEPKNILKQVTPEVVPTTIT